MIRHRGGGTRRGDAGGLPSTIPELARTLRRARTRQGLRVEDVSARTGLPLDQIHALETGGVDRLPDRVAILKTLRRYADFLGLPGDRLVLGVLDRWPTAPGTPGAPAAQPLPATGRRPAAGGMLPGTGTIGAVPAPMATRVMAAGGPGGGRGAATSGAVATPVARVDLPPSAGAVPVQAGRFTGTAQVPAQPGVADTGVIPAYQAPAAGPAAAVPRRRVRTPLALRLLVVVVALAVAAGVAGLVVHRYEPHWLVDLGITHGPRAGGTPGAGGSGNGGGGATATSTTTAAGGFHVTATTPGSATFAVPASSFTVAMGAVGGPSWVDATPAGSTTPSFSGIVAAGQSKSFTVTGGSGLTVVVGSVAAHAYVSVAGKTVGYYFPPAAPYTMTFRGTG